MDSPKSPDDHDHEKGEPTELWKKMALMRKLQERFQALQDDDDMDQKNDDPVVTTTYTKSGKEVTEVASPREKVPVTKATSRWSKIRRIVLSDKLNRLKGVHSANATPSQSPRLQPSDHVEEEDEEERSHGGYEGSEGDGGSGSAYQSSKKPEDTLELEDINLDAFWDKTEIIRPFELTEDISKQIKRPDEKPHVYEEFDTIVTPQALPVSRIPEEIVHEKKAIMEKATIEKHKEAVDNMKKLQTDVIWREDLARKRVKEMEKKARTNLLVEKAKVVKLTMEKERDLSLKFRKAREDLEEGIKRQEGAVKENFGTITIHRDSLARKYQVFTQRFPQPVEMRIHMLRGVKNKLPKGAYALMLTQYESLGGHPISWSHLDACGIGSARPGITRIVKHPGRYFDRIMRFEDSVFALCPPGPALRPSFVFVLELFRLASHRNPVDEIVAWTALPMTFENMSLVEGKMRLPMLRGEHSPYYQHFRTMEQTIANDLSNWLCNVYLEVRHLSLQELGATEAMLKSVDYDLDYISKAIVSGKDLQRTLLSYEEAYQGSIYATRHKLPSSKGGKDDAGTEGRVIPLLPVDKGIFRRKLAHRDIEKGETAEGDDGVDDEEKKNTVAHGGGGGGGGGASHGGSHGVHGLSMTQQLSRFFSVRGHAIHPGRGGGGGGGGADGSAPSAFHGESRMSKVENFVEHRQELIHKWKQNIRMKLSKLDNEDDDGHNEEIEVLERGYHLKDEEFLHPEQRGKLPGVESIDNPKARAWAAAGLEGTVVRKWQSEGPRLDSDAILSQNRLSPKSPITPGSLTTQREGGGGGGGGGGVFFPEGFMTSNGGLRRNADGTFERDTQQWEELRDGRELSEYTMSIAYDPTRSKNLMPGAISRSKLRYMTLELFGDLFPMNYGTFDFYVSLFSYIFALWMRIYVHYLSQYLYILGVGTPLYDFQLGVLQISFKYSSTSVSDATEVAIVAIGMLGNILMMLCLSCFGVMMYQLTDLMPDGFSKFFAAYGVVTVLDPYLITLVDLAYHNYACTRVSEACSTAYTSDACDCFYGDFVKLYSRMLRDEGSGITGAFITFVLFFSCSVLSLFLLYEYLVYIHRDGRILDLWRRITAPNEEFFVPDDLEVSHDELMLVLSKCRRWFGPAGARRKVTIEASIEKDPEHKNYLGRYTRYVIHEVEKDGSRIIHRQFLMDQAGKIVELFEDYKVKMQRQNVFAVFNKNATEGGASGGDGGAGGVGADGRGLSQRSGRSREDNGEDVMAPDDLAAMVDSDHEEEREHEHDEEASQGSRRAAPAASIAATVPSAAAESRRSSRQNSGLGEEKESAARSTSETDSLLAGRTSAPTSARGLSQRSPRIPAMTVDVPPTGLDGDSISPLHQSLVGGGGARGGGGGGGGGVGGAPLTSGSSSSRIPLFETAGGSTPGWSGRHNVTFTD